MSLQTISKNILRGGRKGQNFRKKIFGGMDEENANITFGNMYSSFEQYVQSRWGISDMILNQLEFCNVMAAGSSVLQFLLKEEYKDSDLDLYYKEEFEDDIDINDLMRKFTEDGWRIDFTIFNEYRGGFMAKNRISKITTLVKNNKNVQLIATKIDVKTVIDRFDLDICSKGYDFVSGEFYESPDSPRLELRQMNLRHNYFYKFKEGNLILFKRIMKYIKRGFQFMNNFSTSNIRSKLRKSISRIEMRLEEMREIRFDYLRGKLQPRGNYKYAGYMEFLGNGPDQHFVPHRSNVRTFNLEDGRSITVDDLYSLLIAKDELTIQSLKQKYQDIVNAGDDFELVAEIIRRYTRQEKINQIENQNERIKTELQKYLNMTNMTRDSLVQVDNTIGSDWYYEFYTLLNDEQRQQFEEEKNIYIQYQHMKCSNEDDNDAISFEPVQDISPLNLFKKISRRRGNNGQEIIEIKCYDAEYLSEWVKRNPENPSFPDRSPLSNFHMFLLNYSTARNSLNKKLIINQSKLLKLKENQISMLEKFILGGNTKKNKKNY